MREDETEGAGTPSQDELLEIFVGRSWESHYRDAFATIRSGRWPFNWAAALVPMWLASRGMWLLQLAAVALHLLLWAMLVLVAEELLPPLPEGFVFDLLTWLAVLAPLLVVGLLEGIAADRLLYRRAVKATHGVVARGLTNQDALRAAGRAGSAARPGLAIVILALAPAWIAYAHYQNLADSWEVRLARQLESGRGIGLGELEALGAETNRTPSLEEVRRTLSQQRWVTRGLDSSPVAGAIHEADDGALLLETYGVEHPWVRCRREFSLGGPYVGAADAGPAGCSTDGLVPRGRAGAIVLAVGGALLAALVAVSWRRFGGFTRAVWVLVVVLAVASVTSCMDRMPRLDDPGPSFGDSIWHPGMLIGDVVADWY